MCTVARQNGQGVALPVPLGSEGYSLEWYHGLVVGPQIERPVSEGLIKWAFARGYT